MHEAVLAKLERRLGRLHAKLRLGIEMDHEAQIPGGMPSDRKRRSGTKKLPRLAWGGAGAHSLGWWGR